MESTERIPGNTTSSFDDLDLDELREIENHLPGVRLTEIVESHSLYKLALIYAARGSHKKFMRKIALAGVGLKNKDIHDQLEIQNDISDALKKNDFAVLLKLMKSDSAKAYVMQGKLGNDLITSVLLCGCSSDFLGALLELYASIHGRMNYCYEKFFFDSHGLPPLISAVLAGNVDCVKYLLNNGADIDISDSLCNADQLENAGEKSSTKEEAEKPLFKKDSLYGPSKTALMYAVCSGNLECVEVLLKFKPDMKKRCHTGRTALSYALITSNYDCLNLLLTTPVKIDKYKWMGSATKGLNGDTTEASGFHFGSSFNFMVSKSKENDKAKSKREKKAISLKRKTFGVKSSQEEESDECDSDSTGAQSDGSDVNSVSNFSFSKASPKKPITFDFGDTPTSRNSDSESLSKEQPFTFNCGTSLSPNLQPKFTIGDFSPKSNMRPSKLKSKTKHQTKKEGNASMPDFIKHLHITIDDGNSKSDVRTIAEASLPFAILGDDIKCLELLLNHCGNLECLDKSGKTPLLLASETGKSEYAKLLLKNWAGVNSPSLGLQETALMLAVKNGHKECVSVLLQHNANLEAENWCKETALMYAAKSGRVECLKMLIEHKANVLAISSKGHTPLMIAAENGNTECVELLLKSGSKANESDWCLKTVLMYAAESGSPEIVEVILKALLQSSSEHNVGQACSEDSNVDKNKNPDLILDLPSKEINKKGRGVEGEMIGDWKNAGLACSKDTGADCNPDSKLDPPANCDEEVIIDKKVRVEGEKIEVPVKKDSTESVTTVAEKALPYSVKGGNIKCLKMILPLCKQFNSTEMLDKKTALMLAAEKGLVECVKLLIEHGADLDFVSEKDTVRFKTAMSAVMSATLARNKECLQLLLENGADPNKGYDPNQTEQNPVTIATRNKDIDCLKLLMNHGADVMAEDSEGLSAFLYALESYQCLNIMISAGIKIDINDYYVLLKLNFMFLNIENLQSLLKEGGLTMNEVLEYELGNINCIPYFNQDNKEKTVAGVKLFMEYGVFDWRAWVNEYNIKGMLHIALLAGIRPERFFHEGILLSPVEFALYANEEDVLKYLLSNLYLTWSDYRLFTSDRKCERLEPGSFGWLDPELMTTCCRNPWRLETLCLLTVSESLFKNASSTFPRTKQVNALPIPEKFKTILKFNGSHSRLCLCQWSCIGKPPSHYSSSNILNLTKPSFTPSTVLSECNTSHCDFQGIGLNVVVQDGCES